MWYKKKTGSKSEKQKLIEKIDKEFSIYIRRRDSFNGAFKCISCGKIKPISQADCGHYFSRRLLSVRFDEDNAHAECSYCNRFDSSHLDGYRDNLINKIGRSRFEMLKFKSQQTSKLSEFDLRQLLKFYKTLNGK